MNHSSILFGLVLTVCLVGMGCQPMEPEQQRFQQQNVFLTEKYKELPQENSQQISEQLLEEYLFDIANNVILFANNQTSETLEVFKETARLFKEGRKEKERREMIFSYLVESDQAMSYKRFNIQEESVVYFYKSQKKAYKGVLTVTGLLSFMESHIDRTLHTISTIDDFTRYMDRHKERPRVLAVVDRSQKKQRAMFVKMLENDVFADIGDFSVGIAYDQSVIPYPDDTEMPCLLLYHGRESMHKERSIKFEGDMGKMKEILDWLVVESLEKVVMYSELYAYRLFAGPVKQQLILFLGSNKNSISNKRLVKEMREAAVIARDQYRQLEERVLFAVVYYEREYYDLVSAYGVYGEESLPRVVLSQVNQEVASVDKYLFDKDEIESSYLLDFVQEVKGGEVDRYMKSEESGQVLEGGQVVRTVGSDYNMLVKNNKENVVVLYCSKDDQFRRICDPAIYIYEFYVGRLVESGYTGIKFLFYDIYRNEVEGMDIQNMPTVGIYKRGSKKKPVFYKDTFNVDELKKFIQKSFKDLEVKFSQEDINGINFALLSEEDRQIFSQQSGQDEQQRLQRLKKEQEANQAESLHKREREKKKKRERERETQEFGGEEEERFRREHPEAYRKYEERFQEERAREEQKKYTEDVNAHKYDL